jgi:hypothetical protein
MKPFCAWVIILVALSGCAVNKTATNNIKGYQYTVPDKTNDGWETGNLSSENGAFLNQ